MSLLAIEVATVVAHPEWLDEADQLALTKKSLIADSTHLRQHCDEFDRAVIEVATAQRSAVGKLPGDWLLSSGAVQQTTPFVATLARARRLTHLGVEAVADVTYSIGTEVAAIDREGLIVVGFDLDLARLAMARHNVGKNIFAQADALRPAFDAPVIVVDPAHRAGGRRITNPENLFPSPPALIAAWPGKELAIKCAPGFDFSEWSGEVAIAPVGGAVRETCLYTPGLVGVTDGQLVMRSAMVIQTVDKHRPLELSTVDVQTYDNTMPDDVGVRTAGRYIIGPDGAIVHAGLVRHFAAAYGLWQLDERIVRVSGDVLPQGIVGFEVIEQVGLKPVRKTLAALDCGSVGILVRSVDVNPDVLHKQWKLRGSRALAVVVTRIRRSATAFICQLREIG